MITIDQIRFDNLRPHDGKVTKCFEQLCYQIAKREYGDLGIFTAIDGDGGDGGVEFYLKLPSGDVWGWQCKFFGESGRLDNRRRKNIEESLERACSNHPNLKKWFLCLKTDLTPNITTTTKKIKKGEQNWFDNELIKVVPSTMIVSLEHWGETNILHFLNSTKQLGLKEFFFGEIEFSQDWIKNKFKEQFEKVKDKYDPELHTIDEYTQSIIDILLMDNRFLKLLENRERELKEIEKKLIEKTKKFDESSLRSSSKVDKTPFVDCVKDFNNHINQVYELLAKIKECFHNYDEDGFYSIDYTVLDDDFNSHSKELSDLLASFENDFNEANDIMDIINDFQYSYANFFRNYIHDRLDELNFLGGAANGKTHISCDIANNYLLNNKPVIFMTGEKFSNETSITKTFVNLLDKKEGATCEELLDGLDIYGSITKCKIPIIIDGLNETTYHRYFSDIWKNHLAAFASSIKSRKNLTLITTCRTTYATKIWGNNIGANFHELYGFDSYEITKEAVLKYFKKYKISSELSLSNIEQFSGASIYLKIYCEIKNPNWKTGHEVEVNIDEDTTYNVFKEYLNQINNKVTNSSHLFHSGENFIYPSLFKLAVYLWEKNVRKIPLRDYYKLIDGDNKYIEGESKAEILIHEGLLMNRDIFDDNKEYVGFTYDILAGYIIGEHLINSNPASYFSSSRFIKKIVTRKFQHPLYEDVMTAICSLFPQLKKKHIHNVILDDRINKVISSTIFKKSPKWLKQIFKYREYYLKTQFSSSIKNLFKLPTNLITETDKELVRELFYKSDENKGAFFSGITTLFLVKHPLNSLFFHELLEKMSVSERDLTWTEFIRNKGEYKYNEFIDEFEKVIRINNNKSELVVKRYSLIVNFLMWFLTTTNRNLRDKTTKALYFYGCKYPEDFYILVVKSLRINDPYVWERMLAALYGITMALHNSIENKNFTKELLPKIAIELYNNMFAPTAKHTTTHILARDYAKRTIDIALIYHPNLLNKEEIDNIIPPFKFGQEIKLKEINYGEINFEYSRPIHMDFTNYTIGHIVKGGHSYSDPPEKQKVRRQIYWRIYNLGWSVEKFKEVEKAIKNHFYDYSRSERPRIERYGKKYSWIAFFENAGIRDDLGLLDKEWEKFRITNADIDPSFPQKPIIKEGFNFDTLGDGDKLSLLDWYNKGETPDLRSTIKVNDIDDENNDWICLDGFISQKNLDTNRNRFIFIRSLIVKEQDYDKLKNYISVSEINNRWLPEKSQNYYSYAGEYYYCNEATYNNFVIANFETGTIKEIIKKDDPDFILHIPRKLIYKKDDSMSIEPPSLDDLPEEIEVEHKTYEDLEVLLPAMEYNWEAHHSNMNEAGHQTTLSKEIANHLGLINKPQTFDLIDSEGKIASANFYYHNDYNDNFHFNYLRKDLLDKYLKDNNYKIIFVASGERDVVFKKEAERTAFYTKHRGKGFKSFKEMYEYDSL